MWLHEQDARAMQAEGLVTVLLEVRVTMRCAR
jgi:hypothetical protein